MRRRDVLRYAGAAAVVGATGCLGEGSGTPGDDGNTTDGDGNGDGDDTGTSVSDTSFEVESVTSGTGDGDASVTFEEGAVRVDGTASGNNGCYTARLGGVSYDEEEDRVTVNVETFEDRDEDEMCTEALVGIDYSATAEFDGGLPSSVEVRHDDETVIVAERGTHSDVDGGISHTEFRVAGAGDVEREQIDDAGIEFQEEEGRVVVDGTIRGSDACQTAALGSAEYDAEEDNVSLEVVTRNREGTEDQACAEVLTAIRYVARVYFDDGIPNNASVSHDGRVSFGASYASQSVSGPEDGGS